MEKINKLIQNDEYCRYLKTIEEKEKDRKYCKHNYSHFLDVARLMYIECLENKIDFDVQVIYATALLHDIGRAIDDEKHDIESAKLVENLLKNDFTNKEIQMIVCAILGHRQKNGSLLGDILYRADKMARNCYYCNAADSCKWKIKNERIIR